MEMRVPIMSARPGPTPLRVGRFSRAEQETVLVQLLSIAQHFSDKILAGVSLPLGVPQTPCFPSPCCPSGNPLPTISCPWVS